MRSKQSADRFTATLDEEASACDAQSNGEFEVLMRMTLFNGGLSSQATKAAKAFISYHRNKRCFVRLWIRDGYFQLICPAAKVLYEFWIPPSQAKEPHRSSLARILDHAIKVDERNLLSVFTSRLSS